jgi:lipopolysaccharide cholinephosphotransferase
MATGSTIQKPTDKQLKDELLSILVMFDQFCREHDIKYWLFGGTLLGAVRHHGFIPWDDDIDIAMTRDDWNKLVKVWDKAPRYRLVTGDTGEQGMVTYGIYKLYDTEFKSQVDDVREFIYAQLDIFVHDRFPANKLAAKWQDIQRRYNMKLMKRWNQLNRVDWWGDLWKKTSNPVNHLAKKLLDGKLTRRAQKWDIKQIEEHLEEIVQKYDHKGKSNFMIPYCTNYEPVSNTRITQDEVDHLIELDFEGHKMYAQPNYDEVLTARYGDYMKPAKYGHHYDLEDGDTTPEDPDPRI